MFVCHKVKSAKILSQFPLKCNHQNITMPVGSRLGKSKRPRSDVTHDEIQALLTKLKEIVPNMPRNRKLSKLEIIQYVIDYIVDLQLALESHPISHPGVNPRNQSPSPRQPLGVITTPANSVANTCASHEDDKDSLARPQVSPSDSRSVSCHRS